MLIGRAYIGLEWIATMLQLARSVPVSPGKCPAKIVPDGNVPALLHTASGRHGPGESPGGRPPVLCPGPPVNNAAIPGKSDKWGGQNETAGHNG